MSQSADNYEFLPSSGTERGGTDAPQVFRRIAVAFDGSNPAIKALKVGEAIAKRFDAELIILQVVKGQDYGLMGLGPTPAVAVEAITELADEARRGVQKEVRGIVTAISDRGVRAWAHVLAGGSSVADEIARFAAKENIDLIVVGTRRFGALKKWVHGSVSERLTKRAGCHVVVVK